MKSLSLLTRAIGSLAVLLLLLPGHRAYAQTQSISYLDESGAVQQAAVDTAHFIQNTTTELNGSADGWFYLPAGTADTPNYITTQSIQILGDVKIILGDYSRWTATSQDTALLAALQVNQGNSVTFYAQSAGDNQGKLSASGSCGIGSAANTDGGKITIYGGDIEAQGILGGAGIGGGMNGSNGDIWIAGGKINAHTVQGGAGIGGSGGKVSGPIKITGGTISASSTQGGAGIGGGNGAASGPIEITGGTIQAHGDSGSAGIGGGMGSFNGPITISGGKIQAVGGDGGAGIGSGKENIMQPGAITITGGTVDAQGSSAQDIGPGQSGTAPDIVVDGGSVAGSMEKPPKNTAGKAVHLCTLPDQPQVQSVTVDGKDYKITANHSQDTSLRLYMTGEFVGETHTILTQTSGGQREYRAVWDGTRFVFQGLVPYLDENGTRQTVWATAIDSSTTNLSSGWYYLPPGSQASPATVQTDSLIATGDVRIILGDYALLKAVATADKAGIEAPGGLYLYAQSLEGTVMGSLQAQGGTNSAGIGGSALQKNAGSIFLIGGKIQATGQGGGAGIGGGASGSWAKIQISGGQITAQGGSATTSGAGIGGGGGGTPGGQIFITGGLVQATGGGSDPAHSGGSALGGGAGGHSGAIQITGGTTVAAPGRAAPAIGGGLGGSWGSLAVSGGSLFAPTVQGTATNGAPGTPVYMNSLLLKDASNGGKPVTGGFIDGVACAQVPQPASGVYGIHDALADNSGKVFFWLTQTGTTEKILQLTCGSEMLWTQNARSASQDNAQILTPITALTVQQQPLLQYLDGQALDLSQLIAALTYGGKDHPIAYKDFAAYGITLTYEGTEDPAASGNTLHVAPHNGKPIALKLGTLGASTQPLQVSQPQITLRFMSAGGVYASRTLPLGSTAKDLWPNNPERSGYLFGGWYTQEDGKGNAFTQDTPLQASLDVYAKWTAVTSSSSSQSSQNGGQNGGGDGGGGVAPAASSSKNQKPASSASYKPAASSSSSVSSSSSLTAPQSSQTESVSSSLPQAEPQFPRDVDQGDHFTIYAPEGSLSWDETLLQGVYDKALGAYQFTALQTGETSIVMTDIHGEVTRHPLAVHTTSSETQKQGRNIWILCLLLLILVCIGLLIFLLWRRRKNQQEE